MINTLWKYFKPRAKVFNSLIMTGDETWYSNGFVAYKRQFYYVPKLEKAIVLGGDTRDSRELKLDSIEKLYTGDFTEIKLAPENLVITLEHWDLPKIMIDGVSYDARYVASLVGYLKEDYKSVKLFSDNKKRMLVAKISDMEVAVLMGLNDER